MYSTQASLLSDKSYSYTYFEDDSDQSEQENEQEKELTEKQEKIALQKLRLKVQLIQECLKVANSDQDFGLTFVQEGISDEELMKLLKKLDKKKV